MIEKKRSKIELLGAMAASGSFSQCNSSSRLHMLANHLSQAVSPKHSDIPRIMPGLETQMTSFDTRMPTDSIIISVHHKFVRQLDAHAIKSNPTTSIIFQCQETGIYDTLTIDTYHSKHIAYGVKQVISPIVAKLRKGFSVPRDTILAQSPNVKVGGIYANGLSCSVANISLPGTIEDGYVISRSLANRAALLEMRTVVGQSGKRSYMLNLYGTEEEYKPYPNVGDVIRSDGLVFATREYSETFDALEMSTRRLMEVDMNHDTCVYGSPGAIVYDVTVESGIGETMMKPMTPEAMALQSKRYIRHGNDYYSSILDSYNDILMTDRKAKLSPQLIQLITRAYGDTPNVVDGKNLGGGKIRRVYKNVPLDEYRVEIKYSKENPLAKGAKLTGLFGDCTNSPTD